MVASITASNQRAASDDLVVNSLEAAVFLDNLYKLYITQSMFYKFPRTSHDQLIETDSLLITLIYLTGISYS